MFHYFDTFYIEFVFTQFTLCCPPEYSFIELKSI